MTRAADVEPASSENATSPIAARIHPVTLGTFLAVVSAVAYMGTNIALREVARAGDPDWAVWVSCIKAAPAALAAWGLIGYRALRGLPAMPPRSLILPLLLTGLLMQFGGNVAFSMGTRFGWTGTDGSVELRHTYPQRGLAWTRVSGRSHLTPVGRGHGRFDSFDLVLLFTGHLVWTGFWIFGRSVW